MDGLSVAPKYDLLGRNGGKSIAIGGNATLQESISYLKVGDHATALPSTVAFFADGKRAEGIQYKYDSMGNIIKVLENGRTVFQYEYDGLGRITREDNAPFGKTTMWAYDSNGNILARYEYALTATPTDALYTLNGNCVRYEYDQKSGRLVSYDGEDFVYDEIGNPTTYRGKSAVWSYGQLRSMDGNTFSYDVLGRRVGKNDIAFIYDGNGNLIKQSNGLAFLYDHTGVFAVKYGGSTYFYRKNAQNDIIALLDKNGYVVVQYKYDAWGNHKVLDANGTEIADAGHIGYRNPFRYRSYYYDTETGLYFLKTRYYDPETGRFLSPDSVEYLDPETIGGLNLYAYCNNNPVMFSDPEGHMPKWLSTTLKITAGVAIIAGLVVGSVLTGGTLSVVLAGAAIGAMAGAASAGVSTLVSGGDVHDFANSFLIGTASGAISGAVAAGPLGVGGQIVANAVLGMGTYATSQVINGDKITLGGLMVNGTIGAVAGWIGQNGWMTSDNVTAFIALGGKNAISHVVATAGMESIMKMVLPAFLLGGGIGGLYGRTSEHFNPNGNFIGI